MYESVSVLARFHFLGGDTLLLKSAVLKFKHRKLKTLDGYVSHIAKLDISKDITLTIGDESELKEPDYDNLYTYLSEYDEIKEKYSLNKVVNGDSDFERALSLMQWLTDNTYYNGNQLLFHKWLPDITLKILKFSYGKPFEYAINCRYKAVVLTDLLIAYGIKAVPVALLDADNDGNHIMVHAFLSDEQKWVLLDPSFNTYFTDEAGNVLNVFELRDRYLNMQEPIICGYNFNGTTKAIDVYKVLFIKSCMANISTWHDNTDSFRNSRNFSKRKLFDCKVPH